MIEPKHMSVVQAQAQQWARQEGQTPTCATRASPGRRASQATARGYGSGEGVGRGDWEALHAAHRHRLLVPPLRRRGSSEGALAGGGGAPDGSLLQSVQTSHHLPNNQIK